MANRTKLTSEKEAQFLHVLSETANVTRAAEAIGMARGYMYELRSENEDFKTLWDAAVELGSNALEDEATRRATEGWDEPVFYQGAQCGLVRKFSDTLLIVQLKARRPDKYRDRIQGEFTGKDGKPLVPAGNDVAVALAAAVAIAASKDPIEAARKYQELMSAD